jgi:hypothetical protein
MACQEINELHRYLLERQTTGKGLIWIQLSGQKTVVRSNSREEKGKVEAQEVNIQSNDEGSEEDRWRSENDDKMDDGIKSAERKMVASNRGKTKGKNRAQNTRVQSDNEDGEGMEQVVRSKNDDEIGVRTQSAKSKKIAGSSRGKGKGRNKAPKIKVESNDEGGEGTEKDGKMDSRIRKVQGSEGSISKRRHGMLGSGEEPPAKRQKKMVSDSSTRYGASQISLTLLI